MKIPAFLFLFLLLADASFAQKYKPLEDGSKIHFVIKNFGINTGGDFQGLSGEIIFDPEKLAQSSFNVTVKAVTIDTDNKSRDKNLKEDYFEAEKFPEIRIVSTKVDKTNKSEDGYYFFTGNVIIRDISKPIAFPFKAEKQNGNYLFTGEFQINRLDFNVGSNSTVLSNKVNVSLKVLAKKK